MKFLRTSSTSRLVAVLVGLAVAIVAGAAIAVAATTSSATPKPKPLADSLHSALTAKPVGGFFADINFTNGLISSSDFTGDSRDPILQGASGRIWISNAGQMRLELQGNNGDAELLVNGNSFWISDPMSHTVYKGTLPAQKATKKSTTQKKETGIPAIAQLQTDINRLMGRVNLTGARTSDPTNVGGQPAYSIRIAPRHDGGLLGAIKLAWDAVHGVPLQVNVYAAHNATPVLGLTASNISYGASALAGHPFDITPPANYTVTQVATPAATGSHATASKHHKPVTGAAAVAAHLPFALAARARVDGLPRQSVKLLSMGNKPAALVTYGQGLGGIMVIEHAADSSTGKSQSAGTLSNTNLSLPKVTIHGSTGTELATALGTVLTYTRNGVSYTLLGSVPAIAAEKAAQTLTP